jgi:glycosyltransferase involved in cell wall biosynthesis
MNTPKSPESFRHRPAASASGKKQDMPPRFTIVIPVWKTHHLGPALDSARAQNMANLEILVIDDHSPEDVSSVVRQMEDPRIRLVRLTENLGGNDPTRTWNKGLELARGEFIVILGDDDLLADTYLQEMAALIDHYPNADLYRARLNIIGPDGALIHASPGNPELETWDEFLYTRNHYKHPLSTSEMCARADALRALGGYIQMPLALGSDDLTWLSLMLRHPLVSTNATHACWRIHPGSICGTIDRADLRIQAFRKSLRTELEIIERHEPTRIPRELLRTTTLDAWNTKIRRIQAEAVNRPRRGLRLLVSLLLPSFFEAKLKELYRRRQC